MRFSGRGSLRQGIARLVGNIRKLVSGPSIARKGAATYQENIAGAEPYPLIDRNYEILAKEYGLGKSMELKLPVDAAGEPIPWYTYPAIEYLRQFKFRDKVIFEYGCGSSTLFWGKQAAKTVSVEHDPNWADQIKLQLGPHQTLLLCEEEEAYVCSIQNMAKKIDVLIVDGQWRMACAREGIAKLTQQGIIILDNTDWFHDVATWLRNKGFFQVDFSGFGPINPYCWTTSVFLPWNSSLQNEFKNPLPIGGISCE
jgi:hypothetical protein